MGTGEDHMDKWWPFWNSLTEDEKQEYKIKYPTPDGFEYLCLMNGE